MKNALGVQVTEAHGDLQGQLDPCGPAQELIAVQQLLQVSTVNVLKKEKIHHETDITVSISLKSSYGPYCIQEGTVDRMMG